MSRLRCTTIAIALSAVTFAAVDAQTPAPRAERTGRRPMLPVAEEIALARSAAPPGVSDSATIYVLGDSSYTVAVRGSNGVACYVSRSWSLSVEPHCFDAEGAATIMRMHMREVELLHRGMAYDAAKRQVAGDLAAGTFRLPRRPAMSYMMSGAQQLYSDTGQPVGAWQPHVMVYYPFLSTADIGMRAPDMNAAIVADDGAADSSIMIVVKQFVQPRRGTP